MSAMTGKVRILRNTAFVLMTLFGVLGGLFAAGYAFEDLAVGAALGVTLAWVVVAAGLAVLALRAPTAAPPAFVVLTVVVAGLSILDATLGLLDRDAVGPVSSIGVLVLATGLGFLGLRRAALAGGLLWVLGLGQLVATVAGRRADLGGGEGPGLGDLLTTSSGVVVVPLLVVGTLFLLAGALGHDSWRFWPLPAAGPRHRPAH